MSVVYWSWPNQQVVREDQSGPGAPSGSPDPPLTEGEPRGEASEFDQMTKEELLAYGQGLGIVPMHQGMSKDEIRQSIEQHQAGG